MNQLLIAVILSLFYTSSYAWDHNERIPLDSRYQLEIEDSYHRPINILKPVYTIWEAEWQNAYPSFWEFLDQEKGYLKLEHSILYDSNYYLVWLDQTERKEYELTFNQNNSGSIQAFSTREGMLDDGKWMYVQIGDRFYAGKEKKYRFHHISLCAGEPVNCAGTFTIKEGKLSALSTISGHYRPDVKQGQNFLEALQNIFELDLSGLKMTYYLSFKGRLIKSKLLVEDFLALAHNQSLDEEISPLFFTEFTDFTHIQDERVKLFLGMDGVFYIGSSKLDLQDPLCFSAGPFLDQATAKLKEGKIQKLMFKSPIENPVQLEEIKFFVRALDAYEINITEARIVIIQNNEKVELSFNQLLEL